MLSGKTSQRLLSQSFYHITTLTYLYFIPFHFQKLPETSHPCKNLILHKKKEKKVKILPAKNALDSVFTDSCSEGRAVKHIYLNP